MSASLRMRSMVLAMVGGAAMALGTTGAQAQEAGGGCASVQEHLLQRKSIAEGLQAGGNKKIDAKTACAGFNRLVANGVTIVKWIEANKEWCQVPDSFADGIKADHAKAQDIRAKACKVAAQMDQMEKQQKSGQGGGLLGGGGLTGSTALPKGAL